MMNNLHEGLATEVEKEILNAGDHAVMYHDGFARSGLTGFHYFIYYYLAPKSGKKYDEWLDYFRYDKSVPPILQQAAIELYLKKQELKVRQ